MFCLLISLLISSSPNWRERPLVPNFSAEWLNSQSFLSSHFKFILANNDGHERTLAPITE